MTAAAELRMPLGCVEMDAEEMEYLEGGFRIANWLVGGVLNLAIAAAFGGIGNLLTQIGKNSLKAASKTLFATNVKNKLIAKGIAATVAGTASKIAASALTIFAAVADPGMYVAQKIDAADYCGANGYWDIN